LCQAIRNYFIDCEIQNPYLGETSMLSGKSIVIIGGTSGLGLAAALAFKKNGAEVVVSGKTGSAKVASQILGQDNPILEGEAVNPAFAHDTINLCVSQYGKVDGLYHVAGGSGRSFGDGPLHEITLEGWQKTLDLNLTSLMLSNQEAVRQFLKQGTSGSILNISSVLGYAPSPNHFATHAYAAAKSAVLGFSKSIASYYAPYNIRVNVLVPALVDTPMAARAIGNEEIQSYIKSKQPLDGGRASTPNDLTGLACYFMSDQSKFTTGQIIAVDGGWSITDGQLS
jgi:NAD(P)-dependent dehydrogenase (short-subunit alcohol dehydrogenase family)